MEDLFERLKSEPPVKKINRSLSLTLPIIKSKSENDLIIHESDRRDSMPPPCSATVIKSSHKSRSMSPPHLGIKEFKVLLQRKSLEDLRIKNVKKDMQLDNNEMEKEKENAKQQEIVPVKKSTPTKAQQKLFDPAVLMKAQKLKPLQIRRCFVRIRRDNLLKLKKENAKRRGQKNKNTDTKSPKAGEKRKANASSAAPPNKKGRSTNKPSSFFIKIATPTSDKKSSHKKNKEKTLSRKESMQQSLAAAQAAITKPTKFTRTQLLKNFEKRFFRSHVKIERCTHPMMLTFESNARARKQQAKRFKKSKNLSVSFKEQVEIFGDSDSDESTDVDFYSTDDGSAIATSVATSANSSINMSTPMPLVMPARLKKVENGKVIDDIEFDPSLFIDPQLATSSTPCLSPGRKKRDKKSFSPLKGDATPSPSKDKLKMANEKLPPNGLRRLNIDEVDEDDSDDEDEYIVPIEIPQRRGSRTSSSNNDVQEEAAESENNCMIASATKESEEVTHNSADQVEIIDIDVVSPASVSPPPETEKITTTTVSVASSECDDPAAVPVASSEYDDAAAVPVAPSDAKTLQDPEPAITEEPLKPPMSSSPQNDENEQNVLQNDDENTEDDKISDVSLSCYIENDAVSLNENDVCETFDDATNCIKNQNKQSSQSQETETSANCGGPPLGSVSNNI